MAAVLASARFEAESDREGDDVSDAGDALAAVVAVSDGLLDNVGMGFGIYDDGEGAGVDDLDGGVRGDGARGRIGEWEITNGAFELSDRAYRPVIVACPDRCVQLYGIEVGAERCSCHGQVLLVLVRGIR